MEDRLSNLPEHVLHHILSFLDMKYVLPTSLLSRRWQNLWCSLPYLSFDIDVFDSCLRDDSENYRYRKFASFVSMVVLMRDACPIQTFDLIWGFDDDDDDILHDKSWKSDHIHQWFHAADLRNVKEISVQLQSSYDLFEFPDCFFTFKSLTSLTLSHLFDFTYEIDTVKVKLVDKISMPSLKTLHVESLDFSKFDNLFEILFIRCPALETLFLIGCEFKVSAILTISSVHLKHLHIDMICDFELLKWDFVIHASNLLHYFWRSGSWCAFSLNGISSLETANIDPGECYGECYGERYNIQNCKDSKDLKMLVTGADNGMKECLKGLYNVKHLTL